MKNFSFILFLATATVVAASCQPAKQGGYEAPNKGNVSETFGDVTVKIDSSVEKAVMRKDSSRKREYHL